MREKWEDFKYYAPQTAMRWLENIVWFVASALQIAVAVIVAFLVMGISGWIG